MLSRRILFSLFGLSTFLLAFSFSWLVLGKMNFLYPVWHDLGNIGEGIDKFGPKNKFKKGFGDTTKAQRSQLFEEINSAVHLKGEGLEDIDYQTPSSEGPQLLLHHDEIVHLQDVAKLIQVLIYSALVNLLVWGALLGWFILVFKSLPPAKFQLYGLAATLLVAGTVLFVLGPEDVFNQFHIWIFPKEHKWFFYYQDSLMSTLMMAPTLFGWIAASLVSGTVLIYTLLLILIHYVSLGFINCSRDV